MSIGDTTVRNANIGTAVVQIDLGAGHDLSINVQHRTDRFRRVNVQWAKPGARGEAKSIGFGYLDMREGDMIDHAEFERRGGR